MLRSNYIEFKDDLSRRQTEGLLLVLEKEQRRVRPYIRAANVLEKLTGSGNFLELQGSTHGMAEFQPEGSSFTLESMPRKPWGISSRDLLNVEANMKAR